MFPTSPVPDVLYEQWAVPVLRTDTPEDAMLTALVLVEEGFPCIELTYSTPGVLDVLRQLSSDERFTLGLGTVTTTDQVESGVDAGARFLVSFANPQGFVSASRQAGVPAIPGALTPLEIMTASNQGASAVKLFPAHVVGPNFLRDIRAVMPLTSIMATGGIRADVEELRRWSRAGAQAVGIGSSLGTVKSLGETALRQRARQLFAAVTESRAS